MTFCSLILYPVTAFQAFVIHACNEISREINGYCDKCPK